MNGNPTEIATFIAEARKRTMEEVVIKVESKIDPKMVAETMERFKREKEI